MSDINLVPPVINLPRDQNFYKQKRLVIVLTANDEKVNIRFDNDVDIQKNIIGDLANYIANETKVTHNQIPISPSVGNGFTFETLQDNSGFPNALQDPSLNNQDNYQDSIIAPNAKQAFQNTSTSGQLNNDTDGPFFIKKGKLVSSAPSGDEIYKDINQNLDNSNFTKRVQRVLIENNNYNDSQKFVPNPGSTNENDIKVATVSYNTLGLFGPKKFPQVTQDITNNNKISLLELKRLGLVTLLAGAGDNIPNFPDSKSDSQWNLDVLAATAVTPGLGRLGIKFPTSRFDANQAIKIMKPDFNRPTNTEFLDVQTNNTWGHGNTPFSPFAGINSVASIASATILIVTVGGLLFAFSSLKYTSQNSPVRNTTTPQERYKYLGSSDGQKPDLDNSFLDLPKLQHDFLSCLNEGVKSFFGFESAPDLPFGGAILSVLGNVGDRVLNAHGYFNTVLRQIVRGVAGIIGSIGSSFGADLSNTSLAESSFDPHPDNLIPATEAVAIVENLKAQPLVKFINLLATIGDRILSRHGTQLSPNIDDTISLIDAIVGEKLDDNSAIDPGILIAKNRLDQFNSRTTMASRNKRSLLFLPDDFINSAQPLGSDETASPGVSRAILRYNHQIYSNTTNTNNPNGSGNQQSNTNGNRIDADTVKQFEDYLEKDYLPFYFQDLRTNEIISFHAFVGELNESLNAEYTENEGYGRIGTVPIYKNTKRNIGFSFHVLATSPEDFDDMWFKLNKLGTMLFPQWSEGRRVDFNGNKFAQPFSQVPAASPLIRFRIGDLWKSNYSKFSLARLFGISQDVNQFKIGDMTNVPSAINHEQINQRIDLISSRRSLSGPNGGEFNTGEIIRINHVQRLWKASNASISNVGRLPNARNLLNSFPSSLNSNQYNQSNTDFLMPALSTEFTIQDIIRGTDPNSNGSISAFICTVNPGHLGGARYSEQTSNGHRNPSNDPGSNSFIISRTLCADSPDLVYNQALREVTQQAPTPTDPNQNQSTQDNTSTLQQFFSDSGTNANPIFKAFKSTEGRGIAGFIKTMTFDHNLGTWETDKFGGRAPKLVKVQIEFLPIWDVFPGLDSRGNMTAPIWNTGTIMNNYHGGRGLDNSSKTSFQNSKAKLLALTYR